MISQETLKTAKRIAEELFVRLEADAAVASKIQEETSILVEVTMKEPQMFIGEKGQTLGEIQHVFRMMVRKKLQEQAFVFLDINEYRKSKEAYLRELARSAADEVALLKKDKELPVMSSSERRIVHMELGERTDVVAESQGEDPDRRIVVRIKQQPLT
ncbi:MAG: hypothetical protein HYS60_02205 [Candidatus Wildermuthbacteria bacterium]|nr:hypothetical protein [Candidatus Wildermuthbacteria bacterium]